MTPKLRADLIMDECRLDKLLDKGNSVARAIEQAIAAAVAEEREECAKIAHNNGYGGHKRCDITAMGIAEQIRARSNGGEK